MLLWLCAQVVSYGISINLVEVTWKSKIKQQFPNPNDYSAFMGDFSSSTGASCHACAASLSTRWLADILFSSCLRHQLLHARCSPACIRLT